jgi:hypothetical protein
MRTIENPCDRNVTDSILPASGRYSGLCQGVSSQTNTKADSVDWGVITILFG